MYIGISGKIGVGKTTVAKMLLKKFPSYKKIAFGDFLKQEVSQKFNFPLSYCYHAKDTLILHDELPHAPMSVRQILQWWGDQRRKENPLYFVDKMRRVLDQYDRVIIDDVRFPEEAALMQNYGGLLFRIHPYPGYNFTAFSNHKSETALDNFCAWQQEFRPDWGISSLKNVAKEIGLFLQGDFYPCPAENNLALTG